MKCRPPADRLWVPLNTGERSLPNPEAPAPPSTPPPSDPCSSALQIPQKSRKTKTRIKVLHNIVSMKCRLPADRLWVPVNTRERFLPNPQALAPPPPCCLSMTSSEVIQIKPDLINLSYPDVLSCTRYQPAADSLHRLLQITGRLGVPK